MKKEKSLICFEWLQDVAVKRIREDKRLRDDAGYQKYVNQAITELQVSLFGFWTHFLTHKIKCLS